MINLDNYQSLRMFLFSNYPKFHTVVYFKQSWRYNKQWGHHALKNMEFKITEKTTQNKKDYTRPETTS